MFAEKSNLLHARYDWGGDLSFTHSVGAHGFTLLQHAKVGREDARELFEYIQENGLKQTKVKI